MKELITDKINVAIKKLNNAKIWLKEQGDNEESLIGIIEDDLNEAIEHIESVFNDLDLYEQSLNKKQ